MNIVITGIGYVGIVTAVCLANVGHNVICIEENEEKVEKMKNFEPIIFEPYLEEYIIKNKDRIIYTTNFKKAYENADVIFICVGTPERRDGYANLTYLYDAAKQIALSVKNNTIVAIKSTVPIGTCNKIEEFMNSISEFEIEVVSTPEFLSQGTAINNTINAERIIIGAKSENAITKMKLVFEKYNQTIVITNRESSEMIKYASNDFLALKISYINEIANLCEIVNANIDDVAYGMGLDSRIGTKFLSAGIGYGGSCFPKDTKALHWLSKYHDFEIKTVKSAIEVNESQKIKLIKKAKKYYCSFTGLNVAVLGLTFKPNTDDLREAPSLENIPLMLDDGANICVWDKVGMNNFKKLFDNKVKYCSSIEDAISGADICFIFTEWEDIKNFALHKYKKLMKNPIVIDGRNCYTLNDAKQSGIIYNSIGREAIEL